MATMSTDHFLARMAGPKAKDAFDLAFKYRPKKKDEEEESQCLTE
jgi:hypothetical protein